MKGGPGGPPLIPFAIEHEPAPSDQFVIKSVHVTGLAAEVLRPLYATQKGIKDLETWLTNLANPF